MFKVPQFLQRVFGRRPTRSPEARRKRALLQRAEVASISRFPRRLQDRSKYLPRAGGGPAQRARLQREG